MMPPATNPQTMMLPDDIAQRVRATLARMQDESWTARVWLAATARARGAGAVEAHVRCGGRAR